MLTLCLMWFCFYAQILFFFHLVGVIKSIGFFNSVKSIVLSEYYSVFM